MDAAIIGVPGIMPMAVHGRLGNGITTGIGGVDRANAKDAFDAPDDAAHRATDHGADRPRSLTADIGTMRGAVRYALRLRGHWRSKCYGHDAGQQKRILHATILSLP